MFPLMSMHACVCVSTTKGNFWFRAIQSVPDVVAAVVVARSTERLVTLELIEKEAHSTLCTYLNCTVCNSHT